MEENHFNNRRSCSHSEKHSELCLGVGDFLFILFASDFFGQDIPNTRFVQETDDPILFAVNTMRQAEIELPFVESAFDRPLSDKVDDAIAKMFHVRILRLHLMRSRLRQKQRHIGQAFSLVAASYL